MLAALILCGIFQVGLSQTGFRNQNSIFSTNGLPSNSQWILETMQPQVSTSDFPSLRMPTQTRFNQQFSTLPFQQRLQLQFQNRRTQQASQNFGGQSQQPHLQLGSADSPDLTSRGLFAQNRRDWQVFGPPFWNGFSNPFTMQVPNQAEVFQNPFFQPNPFISNSLGTTFINDPQMTDGGLGNDILNPQNNPNGFERENVPRWLANIPQGLPSIRPSSMNDSVSQDTRTPQDDLNNPGNNSAVDRLSASFERFTRVNQGNPGGFELAGNNVSPSMQWPGNPNDGPTIMPLGRMPIDRTVMESPGRLNIMDNLPLFSG